MNPELDAVERAQTVREKAAAAFERADELVRQVDQLNERIEAHRRDRGGAEVTER